MTKNKIPTVSVIMSIYKDGAYLEESIGSILNQTFEDFELIIVNDGADFASVSVLNNLEKEDSRVTIITNNKNLGLATSLNKAITRAKGKYIVRMDGDDVSLPDRISTIVDYLDSHIDTFLVGSAVEIINQSGEKIRNYFPPTERDTLYKALDSHNPMVHPSIAFKNTGEVVYREKFKAVQDYDLYLRLRDRGLVMENIPKVLLKYRVQDKHQDIIRIIKHSSYKYLSLDFSKQRKISNFDDYDNFDFSLLEEITIENISDSRVLVDVIVALLKSKVVTTCRSMCKLYFKKFGLNLYVIYLYLRTFLIISHT